MTAPANHDADIPSLQAEIDRLQDELESLRSQEMSRQLQISETKYRALVEGSSDFIYVLDKDGYFTFANRQVEPLLGYRPAEIVGRHFSEILHSEDVANLGRAFHERRTGERANKRVEVRLRSRSGDTRNVELDIRHFSVNAAGMYHNRIFLGTHGVARDITERKHQETRRHALQVVREAIWSMVRAKEIERVFESIRTSLEIMEIPFCGFGVYVFQLEEPAMLSLFSSQTADRNIHKQEWLIVDETAFIGTIQQTWRQGTPAHCPDLDANSSFRERSHLNSFFGEVRSIVDMPFSHGILTIASSRRAAFPTAQLTFVSELAEVLSEGLRRMEDLQDLTLSENRYRILVETPNLIVMLLDGQNEILYISPQVEPWLGYRPKEFYHNDEIIERIVHPDDLEAFRHFLYADQAPLVRKLEFRWHTRDSQCRWAAASRFPIYETPEDEQLHRASMLQVVIEDITERKQAEAAIKHSLEEKEVLIKEIHHRVKNNLQIISSLLNLQAEAFPDEQVQRIFNDSQNRINSMALIHEELYNTRDLVSIDFGDYVHNLIENLFISCGADTQNIELDIKVDAQPLNLDRAIPLGMIINELVSNAVKYAFPDGRRGKIAIRLKMNAGEFFMLRFSDNGIGLSEEIDIDNPRTLGLKLIATLADQLGSKLELDRRQGTTFTFVHT